MQEQVGVNEMRMLTLVEFKKNISTGVFDLDLDTACLALLLLVCICFCDIQSFMYVSVSGVWMQQQLLEIHNVKRAQRDRERVQQRMPPWPTVWKGDSGA